MTAPTRANWLTELTGKPKPIIGMVHLPALPGTPLFDAAGGMTAVRDWVRRDLDALQKGGIHAVMFCNENDRPYRLDADPAMLGRMIAVVQRVAMAARDALRPDGVVVTQFNGAPAGQTVFHLHFHIIPRWEGETLGRHGAGGMADIGELTALAERVKAKL